MSFALYRETCVLSRHKEEKDKRTVPIKVCVVAFTVLMMVTLPSAYLIYNGGFGSGLAALYNVRIIFELTENVPGSTDTEFYVDNVNVTASAVPIPPAMVLLASWIFGVLCIRRK